MPSVQTITLPWDVGQDSNPVTNHHQSRGPGNLRLGIERINLASQPRVGELVEDHSKTKFGP